MSCVELDHCECLSGVFLFIRHDQKSSFENQVAFDGTMIVKVSDEAQILCINLQATIPVYQRSGVDCQ